MDWDISIFHNLPLALNVTFGSIVITLLIFINYIRKYNTGRFQRNLFCSLLVFYLVSVICDMLFLLHTGIPGSFAFSFLYVTRSVYYLFLALSCYYVVAFIDYMVFRKESRTKGILLVTYTIFIIHALILIFNHKNGFYFYIDPETNLFHRGSHYFIRLLISYCSMLFAITDITARHSSVRISQLAMFTTLLLVFFLGATVDLLLVTTYLIWPFGDAALLYSYFFIVQADSRLDPLTGIGNRFSFNEFTDRLSRHITGDSWAIVMIDMDHFKSINDTLGHQEGDKALRDMSAIIKNCIKGNDFAARYGGDEFVLTIKVEKGLENRVENLIKEMHAEVDLFNARNIRPFKLEFSYGFDIYTQDGRQPIGEFLNHIDSLMYKHKEERRRSDDKKTAGAK